MRAFKKVSMIALSLAILTGCSGGASNQEANADGFLVIADALKDKFGDDAYYTELTITHNNAIGNIISVTSTEDPGSLQMGQWTLSQDTWTQTSEISIEVPEGTQASEFMFQLGDPIDLKKLGELVEKSKEELEKDKDIQDPSLHMAIVKIPKDGVRANIEYLVMLQPTNGGTTFTYSYDLDGELISLDY